MEEAWEILAYDPIAALYDQWTEINRWFFCIENNEGFQEVMLLCCCCHGIYGEVKLHKPLFLYVLYYVFVLKILYLYWELNFFIKEMNLLCKFFAYSNTSPRVLWIRIRIATAIILQLTPIHFNSCGYHLFGYAIQFSIRRSVTTFSW